MITMRSTLLVFAFFSCLPAFAQQPFEGKIRYTGNNDGTATLQAEYFFSPASLRIDGYMPFFRGEKRDSLPAFTQLFKPDSNLAYLINYELKEIQKIVIDTIIPHRSGELVKQNVEEKIISGYRCSAIEITINENVKAGDSSIRFYGKKRCWYADELRALYHPWASPLFDEMVRDGKICLMVETSMIFGKDTLPMEVLMMADHIEPVNRTLIFLRYRLVISLPRTFFRTC